MQVHIHVGSRADLAEVQAVADEVPGLPLWTNEAWQTYVEADEKRHRVILVARAPDGRALGCLAADGFEETVELDLLFVNPAHQQQGIGGLLATFWLAWAQARGAQEAILEVRQSNVAARQLYIRLGFAVQGRRQAYYQAPVEDAVFMWAMLPRVGSGTGLQEQTDEIHRV